jgi:hypothetical protein
MHPPPPHTQVPLSSTITDHLHSGFVEYAFFTGHSRYRDLFRTSSQWWAYNDCVQRWVLAQGCWASGWGCMASTA